MTSLTEKFLEMETRGFHKLIDFQLIAINFFLKLLISNCVNLAIKILIDLNAFSCNYLSAKQMPETDKF